MKMKKAAALILGAVMILQLMACGSEAQPTGKEAASEKVSAESSETETKATDGEIVIHYWAQWTENETQAEVLKEAILRLPFQGA